MILSVLNNRRNNKAWDVAVDAIESAVQDGRKKERYLEWLKEKESSDVQLEHLTIVIDEAVNLEFSKGLVDCGAALCRFYQKLPLAKRVDLVVTGVGLDRLVEIYGPRKFGSDPSKAVFIKAIEPNLEKFVEQYKPTDQNTRDIIEGSRNGVFSSILMTNTRMFFQGVYEVLKNRQHVYKIETIGVDSVDRLAELGSFMPLMDFGVRFYLHANSAGNIDGERKASLLRACFYNHLQRGQKVLEDRSQVQLMPVLDALEELKEDCISIGLLRTDVNSSRALKLLACLGLANPVVESDGESLERMTAQHLLRRNQVCGREAKIVRLKHACPPKSSRGNEALTRRQIELEVGKYKDQEESAVRETIARFVEQGKDFALVLPQGSSLAQGADVFELIIEWDRSKQQMRAQLNLYQCKNLMKKRSGKVVEFTWYRS